MPVLTFAPIHMPRIWGGRALETHYRRALPDPTTSYGEAWEIVDRPEAQSVIDHGPLSGTNLNHLWNHRREEIFGENLPHSTRFPILIKILDCAHDLSIQVHPPAELATSLGGEPKTEMWFIADCLPSSKLHVGLKKNTTKTQFERAIEDGTVAEHVHSITPHKGQSIFIPSGRLHAIGGGFLIHEIQQNSDTTYRVFDWNRKDPTTGQARELHIPQSLASIDFNDIEPQMDKPDGDTLASCPFFRTTLHHLQPGQKIENPNPQTFSLITITQGNLICPDRTHPAGQTLLLPRNNGDTLLAKSPTTVLQITLPKKSD